jgi:hypothetical protein
MAALLGRGKHALTEGLCHLLEVSVGDIQKAAGKIESTCQEDCVPVGVEAQELPLALVGDSIATMDWPTCGAGVELMYQAVDQATDFGEQLGAITKVGAQHLGHGEGQHPMGEPKVETVAEKLREQERTLLGTRRAEM